MIVIDKAARPQQKMNKTLSQVSSLFRIIYHLELFIFHIGTSTKLKTARKSC